MLTRIYGRMRDNWGMLHNDELHNLYSPPESLGYHNEEDCITALGVCQETEAFRKNIMYGCHYVGWTYASVRKREADVAGERFQSCECTSLF